MVERAARFGNWFKRNMPRREQLARNRFLRPFAHRLLRSELWRFTRRSVPRGVALGMVVGILIPVAQTVAAALLALPFRANVAVAAVTTFITNPFTTPPLWVAAYYLGKYLLHLDHITPDPPMSQAAQSWLASWLQWVMAASLPTALGLVVIAGISALVSYALSALCWRMWIANKWRRRGHRRRHAPVG
jgi:hypothetical protein